jgi:hypothetical protein
MIIHILYRIAFIIAMICFPATISVNVRRNYCRIFKTRIDTKIYLNIFYSMIFIIIILFAMIIIVG